MSHQPADYIIFFNDQLMNREATELNLQGFCYYHNKEENCFHFYKPGVKVIIPTTSIKIIHKMVPNTPNT